MKIIVLFLNCCLKEGMKRKYNLLLLLFMSIQVTAQWSVPGSLNDASWFERIDSSGKKYRVYAEGYGAAFSNRAGTWLASGLLQGQLNRDAIDQSFEGRTPEETHWGIEIQQSFGVLIRHSFKNKHIPAWYVDGSQRSLTEAAMSRDFASLLLRGNADQVGQTIQTNPLLFRNLNYQRMGAGILLKDNDESSMLSGYIGLSLLKGGSHYSLEFQEASFYTSAQGDTLLLSGAGTYTGRTSVPWNRGIGVALNAGLEVERGQTFTHLKISDLGVMNYGRAHSTYDWDTTLTYTGVEWNRNRRTLSLPEYMSDTFVQSTSKARYDSRPRVALPCDLSMRSGFKYGRHQVFWASLRVRLSQAFVPEIRLGHSLSMEDKHFRWSNEAGFGGYRAFFWDSDVYYGFGTQLEAGIRIHSLHSLLFKQANGGFGASIRCAWSFGKG